MSGHSHAKTVKRKKDAEAAKRSKAFAKFANEISLAASQGGGDPETNPGLRMVVEKAKKANMPSNNIEKAVSRGTGEGKGGPLEEFLYDAYGPGNKPLLIQGITDNKNRTQGELKQALESSGGKLVEEGAVRWMFTKKGMVTASPVDDVDRDTLELDLIDNGAETYDWDDDGSIMVSSSPEASGKIKGALEEAGLNVTSVDIVWVPATEGADESNEKIDELIEKLEDMDSVQSVFSA